MVPSRKHPAALRSPRRSFDGIRHSVLEVLRSGRMTVSEISRRTAINWKTVDNHLIYLCGRGWAEKVFDSPSVKIFEISEEGVEHLERLERKAILAAMKPPAVRLVDVPGSRSLVADHVGGEKYGSGVTAPRG